MNSTTASRPFCDKGERNLPQDVSGILILATSHQDMCAFQFTAREIEFFIGDHQPLEIASEVSMLCSHLDNSAKHVIRFLTAYAEFPSNVVQNFQTPLDIHLILP
ncbi:hypothetical protein TRICI_002859 [Trichomonascus ciferrii]|uniref:Uncharacterized protein n=1 Tax=Trichomonascus ciferrii TaxID=44093 RepID=A0A642V5L8_9ASCO|nr:hypothetical protein TRICI_002859 [Trichomonascus ciferrii]